MLSERERFICLVDNEPIRYIDAIVMLTGDGFERVVETCKLYHETIAKHVLITGGVNNPAGGSILASEIGPLLRGFVPKKRLIIDNESQNTREQAVNTMKVVKDKKWGAILLVASHYHQYRAYLTFLQARKEAQLGVHIINAPAKPSWHKTNPWGKRIDLLELEFEKIERYRELGHVASYADAFQHSLEKEGVA